MKIINQVELSESWLSLDLLLTNFVLHAAETCDYFTTGPPFITLSMTAKSAITNRT